jgi:4-diphosphocytidyl-2-C-methyl-D-erythritol kinase
LRLSERGYAKLNLALHVRGRLPDGRHRLETLFAFCLDGDRLEGEFHAGEKTGFSLELSGPFAANLNGVNLIEKAWDQLRAEVGVASNGHTWIRLEKNLPVASGIGGGSADAAAALRLLTSMWGIDPAHAAKVAPRIGSDVPACLLSMSARGEEGGEALALVDYPAISGTPVLLVNPSKPLSTREVFARWDGQDRGPLSDWREGRNDLEQPARSVVPEIGDVLDWLAGRAGTSLVRMSGSGATCFALFNDEEARDGVASQVPEGWWHMASVLR